MAEDVIIRDDLVEFQNTQRCTICQLRDRDCLMRKGAGACLLCTDAGRHCVFERTVRLCGPANRLPEDVLLNEKAVVHLDDANARGLPWVYLSKMACSWGRLMNIGLPIVT